MHISKSRTKIRKITGGKNADGAIYLAFNNRIEPSAVFNFLARDTSVAFCSLMEKSLSVNLENALRYNITVKGVTECHDYVSSAINILANKAVTFSEFTFRSYREEELPNLMKEYAQLYESNSYLPEQFDIIKFIF